MLGRELSLFDPGTHRLSVDCHAAQHPGKPSPQAIQSVGVHLVALCLTLEHGMTVEQVRPVMGELSKGRFFEPKWLAPVPSHDRMTITGLLGAQTPETLQASFVHGPRRPGRPGRRIMGSYANGPIRSSHRSPDFAADDDPRRRRSGLSPHAPCPCDAIMTGPTG